MPVYPLVFKPIFKERIWGGDTLRAVFGKNPPAGRTIGESWELADLPGDKTTIGNGPDAGRTLAEVIRREGRAVTGRDDFPSPFPLLVKFLDCADVLSVQVHPDRETCARMGRGDFKTECWYVIRAEAGAVIYKGLRPGVTRRGLEEAVAAGTVADLLNKVTVRAGECHYLPAGTPHTIGGGILIAEVQTPSDTTYRLFDWNRVDKTGRGRPLHVAEALESIHFDATADQLPVTTGGVLVDCPYFTVEKILLPPGAARELPPGVMRVLVVIEGGGAVRIPDAAVPFRAGDTLLVPAALTATLTATGAACTLLSIRV